MFFFKCGQAFKVSNTCVNVWLTKTDSASGVLLCKQPHSPCTCSFLLAQFSNTSNIWAGCKSVDLASFPSVYFGLWAPKCALLLCVLLRTEREKEANLLSPLRPNFDSRKVHSPVCVNIIGKEEDITGKLWSESQSRLKERPVVTCEKMMAS